MSNVKHSGKRIFVGLSGGVDSAVTAALLKDAGASVTGVFIKGWYPPGMPCTWATERRDAMRVAAKLGIPFRTLDASKEYKAGVMEYLLREYRLGRTPNPDIMCNREVKFGAFLRYALSEGADCIATGHYASLEDGTLRKGADASKDQSYFLWAVPKEALQRTLLPLGERQKQEVRKLAKRYRLPVADKKDSQGICFLGSVSVEDYLRSEFGSAPGEAVNVEGKVIGLHGGVLLHTLGERVVLKNAESGPWYVVAKDVVGNRLIVSRERKGTAMSAGIVLDEMNLLGEVSGPVTAQYRYHGPEVAGTLGGAAFLLAEELPETPAPGQSLVLYRGRECLGGGIMR